MLTTPRFAALWAPLLLGAAVICKAQAPYVVSDFENKQADNGVAGVWLYNTDADSHGNSVITTGDTTQNPAVIDSTSFGPGADKGTTKSALMMGYKYGAIMPHGDPPDTSAYDQEVDLETN